MKQILVVGAGLIGARHARAVQDHPLCELAGIVDPNEETHTDPDVRYFRDMADVDVPVDGAIIATPTQLHCDHACAAATNGWDVLIEKPVAGTMEDADVILDGTKDVATLVGHHRRYHADIDRLRNLVQSGEIGTPVTSTMIWAMRKPDQYFEGNWRTAGGSPVLINLVHDVDLLRHVLGEVIEVVGLRGKSLRGTSRLDSGAVALSLASGATATISFADSAPSPWGFEAGTGENPNIATTGQDMWWITGTEGAVSFPSLTHWSGSNNWADAPVAASLQRQNTNPLDAQLDHFIEVMERRAEPMIDAGDARETLRVALAIEAALSPTLADA